jgi:prepilin-type N-terminal cleavage/methylation domain-containing protein
MGIVGVMFMIRKDPLPITARDVACGHTRVRGLFRCGRRGDSAMSAAGRTAGRKGLPGGWRWASAPLSRSSWGGGKKGDGPGGFSLVELIIAIALVAIVTAISVPAFNRYSANADLKTAARAVAADLSSAKQTAVTENIDAYRLTYSVAGNSYALSRTDTGVTLWTKSVASFGGGIVLTAVNFGGGAVVSFQKRGTMTSGSVTLQNNRGSSAVVTVNFTGRTYVTFTIQ